MACHTQHSNISLSNISLSNTFLAHAVLAHISPEVTALDRIIALQSRGALRVAAPTTAATTAASKSLANVPPEILLIVRSYLLPAVTDALLSGTMLAYADSLLSRARRLCAECLKYNVDIYGPDALQWPSSRPGLTDDAQGCECGTWAIRSDLCIAEPSAFTKMDVATVAGTFDHTVGAKRGHKRTNSYSAASVAWLEEYLASRAGRGKPIRDVIADVLASDFACLIEPSPASDAMRPSSSNAEVPDAVVLTSVPSCIPPSAEDRIKILARELALSTSTTTGSELLTAARDMAASVIAATAASTPRAKEPQTATPRETHTTGPSMITLVSAGLAFGAYAVARFIM